MPTLRTVTVKSSSGDYSSLSAAEAGEQADFVSLDRRLDIECFAFSDTTAATVDGSTADATRYMRIFAHDNHNGKYGTAAYRLEVSNSYVAPLYLHDDFVHVEGLQIYQASAYYALVIGDYQENGCLVDRCIVRGAGVTAVAIGTSNSHTIRNTVVYGTGASSALVFINYGSHVLENVTAVGGGGYGIQHGPNGFLTVKNCYAGGNAGGDYNGTITMTRCASSDGTGSSDFAGGTKLTKSLAECLFTNTTPGSEDFHIAAGSPLVGVANDLSGEGWTLDLDSVARTGTWDIGADQHSGAAGGSTYNDSLAFGCGAATTDSVAAIVAAGLTLGAAGGTSDGAAVAIAGAIATGISQSFAATNGSIYSGTLGLGVGAASSVGAAVGASVAAALAAGCGVTITPAMTAQALAQLGAGLSTQPLAVLSAVSQISAGIGSGLATSGGLVFRDSIALGAFAEAIAAQVAGVVAVIGRAMLSDAPAFRASVSDGLAGNATVSDAPTGGAIINDL